MLRRLGEVRTEQMAEADGHNIYTYVVPLASDNLEVKYGSAIVWEIK